jgi:hypothetical protein
MPKGPKGEVRPGFFFMGIAESSTRLEALSDPVSRGHLEKKHAFLQLDISDPFHPGETKRLPPS